MATIRPRGKKWEVIIRNKAMLGDRPISFTVDSEHEANYYGNRYDTLLAQGIMPSELAESRDEYLVLGDLIRDYLRKVPVPRADERVLNVNVERIGMTDMRKLTYQWAEEWIASMKRIHNLAPSTIRHHVGGMARCFDWGKNQGIGILAVNPLRVLRKSYAQYTEEDKSVVAASGREAKEDDSRDRRLHPGEEPSIREVLAGKRPETRQRPLALPYQGALELMFDLALESGMRLAETHTLTLDQIKLKDRTIYLDKTKNGDPRQVPITTVAHEKIGIYLEQVRLQERGMNGWNHDGGYLFPWIDHEVPQNDKKVWKEETRRVTALLSRQFARAFAAAGALGLHYHDLRHEATSRIYERTKLSDVEIAKILGWKSLKMALRYANLRASNLALGMW